MMPDKILPLRAAIALNLIAIGSLILVPSSPALEINVKSRVSVRGDQVYLGDIATFQPADDKRVPRLRRVEVLAAPAPANAFRLKRRFLTYKLTAAIGDQEDICLKVPAALKVHR